MLRNPDEEPDDFPIAVVHESPELNHHIGYELMTLDLNTKRDMFAKQKRAGTPWRGLRWTIVFIHEIRGGALGGNEDWSPPPPRARCSPPHSQ